MPACGFASSAFSYRSRTFCAAVSLSWPHAGAVERSRAKTARQRHAFVLVRFITEPPEGAAAALDVTRANVAAGWPQGVWTPLRRLRFDPYDVSRYRLLESERHKTG